LLAALTEKDNAPNAEDRVTAFDKAMQLKRKSDEELKTYAKGAKKLAKRVDPTLEKVVAAMCVQRIRDRNIPVMVVANSQSKSDYTFRDVYRAVPAVVRATEEESASHSDSSTSTDSSASGGSRKHQDAKRAKDAKATEVEVRMPNPAPTQFNMEGLTNQAHQGACSCVYLGVARIVRNRTKSSSGSRSASASTNDRELCGISPSRPPFSGRGYSYGGQGGIL
jgi:uncharacterized membrane protein YgcG